jgi:hypothetical protein
VVELDSDDGLLRRASAGSVDNGCSDCSNAYNTRTAVGLWKGIHLSGWRTIVTRDDRINTYFGNRKKGNNVG